MVRRQTDSQSTHSYKRMAKLKGSPAQEDGSAREVLAVQPTGLSDPRAHSGEEDRHGDVVSDFHTLIKRLALVTRVKVT